jgi:hypothetical protein
MQRIIARSLHQAPALCDNYDGKTTHRWATHDLQNELTYRAAFNATPDAPYLLEL